MLSARFVSILLLLAASTRRNNILADAAAMDTRQYPADFTSTVIPLTNDNIKSAVSLWLDTENNDRTEVEEIYGGPIGSWNITGVTDLSEVFADVQRDEVDDDDADLIDLSGWDVSRVTSMRALFYNTSNLAVDVASWDTSKVQDMRVFLAFATNFRGDISNWNTDSVQLLRAAFTEYFSDDSAEETLPISNWKTPSLTDMEGLFANTMFFQTDLTGWYTSKVTNMAFLLENSFDFYGGDLSLLDTSSVVSMERMFAGAINIRGARDISQWDTSKVYNMDGIFYNTTVTFDEGTAPADADLFYLCWKLDSLNASGLDEAFCHSNAGGFNCACVREDIKDRINSGCNTTRKTCFDSIGTIGNSDQEPSLVDQAGGSLISGASTESSRWSLLLLHTIPMAGVLCTRWW